MSRRSVQRGVLTSIIPHTISYASGSCVFRVLATIRARSRRVQYHCRCLPRSFMCTVSIPCRRPNCRILRRSPIVCYLIRGCHVRHAVMWFPVLCMCCGFCSCCVWFIRTCSGAAPFPWSRTYQCSARIAHGAHAVLTTYTRATYSAFACRTRSTTRHSMVHNTRRAHLGHTPFAPLTHISPRTRAATIAHVPALLEPRMHVTRDGRRRPAPCIAPSLCFSVRRLHPRFPFHPFTFLQRLPLPRLTFNRVHSFAQR